MQSMRGIVPAVQDAIDYATALKMMKNYDTAYVCYEDEHGLVINKNALSGKKIAILVLSAILIISIGGVIVHEINYYRAEKSYV